MYDHNSHPVGTSARDLNLLLEFFDFLRKFPDNENVSMKKAEGQRREEEERGRKKKRRRGGGGDQEGKKSERAKRERGEGS